MGDQIFYIFSGTHDISSKYDAPAPMLIEQVSGYDAAVARMRKVADDKPGPYFVFCLASNKVVALISTGQHQDERFKAAG